MAGNLERLVRECAQSLTAAGFGEAQHLRWAKTAKALPLTHARTSAQFVRIVTDEKGIGPKVFSPARVAHYFGQPVRPDSAEAVLGTDEFVFLYCGQFRYPGTQVGFLFSTSFEDERGAACESSPFDSGGLHNHMAWPDPAESAQAFLARHSLPVPGYRNLLANRALYLFAAPEHYLSHSAPPIRPDPIGLAPKPPTAVSDPRFWTFEIRARDEAALARPHLAAAFYVARLQSEPSVIDFLAALDDSVHVEQILADEDDAFGALQSRCLVYLRSRGIIPNPSA